MQRSHFPSFLLYGLGLTLALSLLFNAFLLYQHSRSRSAVDTDESGYFTSVAEQAVCQQQLTACHKVIQQQDSLIRQLEHIPNAPLNQPVAIQHPALKSH